MIITVIVLSDLTSVSGAGNVYQGPINKVELAWRSGSVMDCHAMARGSIPDGDSVKTKLHILRKGQ